MNPSQINVSRWLRARKFDLDATIKKVEEATNSSREPRKKNFYPSPYDALGVEKSIFIKQYPQLYYGARSRSDHPVFISKPGVLNIGAVECITTLHGFMSYHWHAMMHEFTDVLKAASESTNGNFKRYECVCILDLEHLTTAQLSKRSLNLTKLQSEIDSSCFPETLNRMVIVNAPTAFTLTWKIIRAWIDARTVSKVDLIGVNQKKIFKCLNKLMEEDSIPINYGGTGVSVDDTLHANMIEDSNKVNYDKNEGTEVKNLETYLMSARSQAVQEVVLKDGEVMKLSIFTRSVAGCSLTIQNSNGQHLSCKPDGGTCITIQHKSPSGYDGKEDPTRHDLEMLLKEPDTYSISLQSHGSRFSAEFFLLVVTTEVECGPSDELANKSKHIARSPSKTVQNNQEISSRSLGSGMMDNNSSQVAQLNCS